MKKDDFIIKTFTISMDEFEQIFPWFEKVLNFDIEVGKVKAYNTYHKLENYPPNSRIKILD